MKTGVSSGCFFPRNTAECLQNVADIGVKYTELFFNTHSELEEEYLFKLKKIADENNIRIISVHPYTSAIETFMFFSVTDHKLEDSLKYYEKYFRACQILGAEYVVIHGCRSMAGYIDMKRYAETMNLLSRRAREYGVFISQENVVNFKCGYIENLKEFIKYSDKEIKFVLDVKQARRAQQNLWELMEIMGKRISHLHISDSKDDRDSVVPGQGDFDFRKLFTVAGEKYNVEYALIEIYKDNFDSKLSIKNAVEMLENLI